MNVRACMRKQPSLLEPAPANIYLAGMPGCSTCLNPLTSGTARSCQCLPDKILHECCADTKCRQPLQMLLQCMALLAPIGLLHNPLSQFHSIQAPSCWRMDADWCAT